MYAVGRLSSYISRGVYTVSGPFHPFGGAVDIIVVEQQDGSFKSSPWYVHFGKFQGVLKAREKIVDISVNGMETRLQMYLDHKGEAYFLKEVDGEESDSVLYPSSSGDEIDEKSQTCDWDANEQKIVDQIDLADGKIVGRTNSRRSRILGLVFGRRSMKEDGLREEAGGDAGMVRASSLERAELAADLLDVKWTTNLSTKKPKKDKTSRFSVPGTAAGEANRESRISRGQSQGRSFVDDETEIRLDHSLLFDETGSLDGDVGKSSDSGSEKSKCSVGESVAQNFSLSLLKQDVEICSLDSKELEERCDFMPVTSENTGAGYSKETETKRAQSYLYCETSESSRLSMDGSSEETQDPICISSENCEEVHVHAESLHVSEVHSPQEPSVLSTNEHLNNLVAFRDGDGSNTINDSKVLESEGIVTETVSSVEIQSITCNAVENEVFEVIHQDTRTCLIESKGMRAVHKDHSDDTDTSELLSTMDSIKNPQELNFYVQEKSISPSEGSKEECSLFNDLDFNPIEVQNMESSFPNCVEKESGSLDMPGGFEGVEKLVTKKYESHSLPSNSVLENFPSDSVELIENLKMTSNPISIPRSHFAAAEETGKMVKSLPNIWSHADNLDSLQLIFPPSRSLDSSSKSLNCSLSRKDIAGFIRSDADKGYQLRPEQPTAEGKQISVELQNVIASPGVEISLCKHLLYEGMGLETASEAFDSEKLDVENFASLVSDITKKDRLVVRISNHYFPWDAAVPIMLGMTCPGNKELIEPKGMIAVDQVEKTSEGDPSKAIISNGNWRIWPFLFKSSRAKRSSQPTQNGSRTSSVENDLESSVGMGEGKYTSKENVTRKKVRTITPTSEQMASLNLKEGRNIVTFSYSTGMLGKQKVDARIYLWKWNTHIVISDVDGTITRSDVLGQFMPMVGVDWSHTGVAHLFSAIKENGYQLLFLSARAISQAYNTRQFLFNLKQDGKALPDGPVVISPDGLFPSLFREVIRRAPHEFKIGCLEDIKALFPSDCNPFYAGFGNRDTDEVSYLKVGIPKGKIFIINPKGQVAVNRRVDTKSYTSLHALVNGMFPPMSSSSSEQEDYNSWNFWRMPFPSIDA